jgi:hypothetical protein
MREGGRSPPSVNPTLDGEPAGLAIEQEAGDDPVSRDPHEGLLYTGPTGPERPVDDRGALVLDVVEPA